MSLHYGSLENTEYASVDYDLGNEMDGAVERAVERDFPRVTDTSGNNYGNVIGNILNRHMNTIFISPEHVLNKIQQISKKRLREIIAEQNNKCLKFFFKERLDRQGTASPLNYAEILCRRFGSNTPINTCVNLSKDLNIDNSSDETFNALNELIATDGKSNIQELVSQLKTILNEYKRTGEEIMLQEAKLSRRLDVMTKLNERVMSFGTLPVNENLKPVMDSFAEYMKTEFSKLDIETSYNDLIKEYKKWNILRQIISFQSMFSLESCVPDCAICMSDKVSHVLVPCGHTICGGCLKNVTTSCYICRGMVRERVKLYYT